MPENQVYGHGTESRWNEKSTNLLKQLISEGNNSRKIASIMNISRNRVDDRRAYLKKEREKNIPLEYSSSCIICEEEYKFTNRRNNICDPCRI